MQQVSVKDDASPDGPRRSLVRDQLDVLGVAERLLQSSVLLGLLRLNVFEAIGFGAVSAAELAGALGVQADILERVLNGGVALRVLDVSSDARVVRYRLAEPFRSVLVRGAGNGYLGDWLLNLDYLTSAVARLDEAVTAARPTVSPHDVLGEDADSTRTFVHAMNNYAALRGRELSRYLDTNGCQTLLDVGCGPGTYAFQLGRVNPTLKLHLLDLPGVLDVTREHAREYAVDNEVHYLALDARTDPIPGRYDLVLVSNVLHMLGEAASRALIERLYQVVNPGGSLVIQAQFLDDNLRGPRWPVMLDLIQLCITEEGRNHSAAETATWMHAAGFERLETITMSLFNTNKLLRGYRA